jgi:nucleoside phosphorylase
MVAVLAALPQELQPLRSRLRASRAALPGVWIGESPRGRAMLALTGMGRQASAGATERLLDRYPVRAVVSTGFAGALSESLDPGQLIVSVRMRAPGERAVLCPDGSLLERALSAGGLRPVATVTVPSAASTPESRQALRTGYEAEAVDMESYWIAEAAVRRGIPFLAIRAVLDTVEMAIPELETGSAGPAASSLRMLLAFLRSPRSFALLPSLWARSRLAAGRLAVFIADFLGGS